MLSCLLTLTRGCFSLRVRRSVHNVLLHVKPWSKIASPATRIADTVPTSESIQSFESGEAKHHTHTKLFQARAPSTLDSIFGTSLAAADCAMRALLG